LTRPSGRRLAIGAAALAILGALAWMSAAGGEAQGSSLSRGPDGWLAARRYLEARGARTRLLAEPLGRFQESGVLVVAFPWQRGAAPEVGEALYQHLRRGGDLVVAYSGQLGNVGEIVALEALGLPLAEGRKATLDPRRWRRFARQEWLLRPATGPASGSAAAPIRVWAPRWLPELPKEAQGLFVGPGGRAVISMVPRGRGRIWLLPADAFANARLANPGNAGLLETLRRRLGDRWAFDEYHHGLIAGAGVESAHLGRTLDLVLVHLAALYLVALWTLSRRFGPAWEEGTVATGSTGTFLLGVGALHHRLGHHRQAAVRLLERVRELDSGLDLPADLDARAAAAGPRELVALAREVAGLRSRRPPESPVTDAPFTAVHPEAERETAA
jgi:hypothetical protein